MPVVDIYCRTATNDPEALAKLEQQETDCRAYCETHGLSIGRVYREVAVSGATYHNRKLLTDMRRRYRNGSIQGVVVYTTDRLSRMQTHLIILLQEMKRYNIDFYCVREYDLDRFTSLILNVLCEVERERALDTLLNG